MLRPSWKGLWALTTSDLNTRALVRLEKERRKTLREQAAWNLAATAVRSPLVQICGTVALAEYLEYKGVLSSRWAGAIEGGVIAMVGLQALKEYGVLGAAGLGLGIGGGALFGAQQETPAWWDALSAGVPPLQLLTMAGVHPK